jgi:hypothetical protein
LYPSSSIKTVLFLKEKDDGSGFGIGYVDLKLHAFVGKKFIFTGIDMSSLNLEILNNFFTNNDEFHTNLTERFDMLKNKNSTNIDGDKLEKAIGRDSDLVALNDKTDEEKAAFLKKLMDSGAFDNVKLDLLLNTPKRIGETDADRQVKMQSTLEVTGTDFALLDIQQKRDTAKKSLGKLTGSIPPPPATSTAPPATSTAPPPPGTAPPPAGV